MPIENVKPGYHDWLYLSPRMDLGFRFVPEDHDYEDGEDKNKNGRMYTLVFQPPRISFSRIYFGLLLLRLIFNNSTSIPFLTAPLRLPSPPLLTNPNSTESSPAQTPSLSSQMEKKSTLSLQND